MNFYLSSGIQFGECVPELWHSGWCLRTGDLVDRLVSLYLGSVVQVVSMYLGSGVQVVSVYLGSCIQVGEHVLGLWYSGW